MKKTVLFLTLATVAGAALNACDTAKRESSSQAGAEQVMNRNVAALSSLDAMEKNGLTVTPFSSGRALNEAQLQLTSPGVSDNLQPGPVTFNCQVSNFRMGQPATPLNEPGIIMSPLGQTITTIIDNEVVNEHGDLTFAENLTGGPHTILTFLTRPTRESLKHRTGFDLRTVQVAGAAPAPKPAATPKPGTPTVPRPVAFNPRGAHLFYNLPRGIYVGEDADRILLDFFLVNTTLDEEATQVRLTINKTSFTLPKWSAYTLEGLPMGPNAIKLELIDAEGKLIPGPYNSVVKNIVLRPGA